MNKNLADLVNKNEKDLSKATVVTVLKYVVGVLACGTGLQIMLNGAKDFGRLEVASKVNGILKTVPSDEAEKTEE